MKHTFVHLRVHTAYSLLEGALKIPQVIDLCKKNKMPALAMTDTNNMFGALEFSVACGKKKVQPIIGVEIGLNLPGFKEKREKLPSIVLLVQTEEGYQNLIKMISHAYADLPARHTPHLTVDELRVHAKGVIALSGAAQGPVGALFLDKNPKEAKELIQTLKDIFEDRFYMEIQRHGLDLEDKTEPFFIEEAHTHNIPLVATNNCFFAEESMYEAHDALLCVSDGAYVVEENRRKETPHHFFKSQEEMISLFHDLPEAIENTGLIVQRCSFMPEPSNPLLPAFSSSSGKSEEEELERQAHEGLVERLRQKSFPESMGASEKNKIKKSYKERLDYEIRVITQMGFPGYFLIVSDFIKWAKDQKIPVGPGRGSGAGSLVAWSLLITDIDPIEFNLIFERFLNPDRISMPDFDIDFCQDRRDEVIHYVQKRYGSEKVAQIITFGTLQARAVLRDVGRVLQMPYPQVDRICKLVPFNPAAPCTLQEAVDQEPLLRGMRKNEESVAKLINISLKLEGLYRHASTHAAGLIIGDRPLDDLVPLYRDPKSDILATQFSMKFVEMAGLVKFDFLGLKTLTILENAAQMVRSEGHDIDISKIPLTDEKTFELLRRVETVGIFQLEGQGMREVLRRLRPERFEDIIDLNALYRPGPMDDIPRYMACKHGEQEVSYLHPALEPILKVTYGVMVYQEQVMEIAQVLGGYTLGGADLLRRAMGKKIKSEMDAQRVIFTDGAIKKGVEKNIASQIFDQMAKFAGYGFNKSHSAPYALISYQTAYMKANFPHEFMAATMTYDMNNTDKLGMYCQELKKINIKLLPPDINKSSEIFSVETDPETQEKSVRYALGALKNVGTQAMELLTEERSKKGPFKNIQDFLYRLNTKVLNKRQLENLILSGSLDCLVSNRRSLYVSIEDMLKCASAVSSQGESLQTALFAQESVVDSFKVSDILEWPTLEKLNKEESAVGFYLSAHPLQSYDEDVLTKLKVVKSIDLEKHPKVSAQLIGLPVSFKLKTSKKGRKFAFVGFSDAYGNYEAVVFSDMLEDVRSCVEKGDPLFVKLSLRRDDQGALRLSLAEITPLDKVIESVEYGISLHFESLDNIDQLKEFLSKKTGGKISIKLFLNQKSGKLDITLPDKYSLSAEDKDFLKNILSACTEDAVGS
ncbi:DNA polymerase III subunit alpha [Alphaproteobacteria bacterium]|nr:DNA polymerase III subunit alpha [Alphaproteobacteria bacterium]